MVNLKKIDGSVVDLSLSKKFMQHYSKGTTYAKYIIEKEINAGQWYDSWLEKLPNDAVVVDAGANVGMFAMYINSKGKKFYCIEPTASHAEIARDLFEKTSCNAEVWEGVIYNKDGEVPLFEDASNSTMNRVGGSGKGVPSLTLKTFLEKNKIEKVDLLKLDIEGSERDVILNDETVGEALQKCSLVLIETHAGFWNGGKKIENDIVEKMKSFGFIAKEGKKADAYFFIK